MNKKNKQTKINGGFNIQPNRKEGIVSYTQMYNGGMAYGVARVSGGDVFNIEQGKAIAFARTELTIRKAEERKAYRVLQDMQRSMRSEMKKDPAHDASRMWSKYISTAAAYHKKLQRYLRNQKRVVELVSEHFATLGRTPLTYTEALKAAHDQALAEEKARNEAKANGGINAKVFTLKEA